MTHDATEELCQFIEMTEHDYEVNNGFYAPPDCQCELIAKVREETLASARRIVAGFLDIDETGDRQCADPACDLCVVAPLIYAALEDLTPNEAQ